MNKRQTGAAAVEFALVLPFLLLLTFITTEFGRAIWEYNILAKSVRDAARYLSVQTPGTKISEARSLMVYGNLTNTGTPVALGLSLANVPSPGCCTWQTAGANPVINTVTVRITGYTFNSIFSTVFGLRFGAVPYPPITATMRAEL